VTLVEWPEQAGARMPARHRELHFTLDTTGARSVTLGR
jgi:tRNA A37 threonylcarbamoyladenosine biosynthesis protein TsaE